MRKSAKGRQLAVTLEPEVERAVEQWMGAQAVPPSKSAALAYLVLQGLRQVAPEALAADQ